LANQLTATINWGDNTPPDTSVPLTGPNHNGQYTVQGTHTYTTTGQYTLTVTVTDGITGAVASDTSTATVGTPVSSSLTVTAQNITAQAELPFRGTVATFSDPGANPSDLVAVIDWGDGTGPQQVFVHGTSVAGTFDVVGWH